MLFAIILYWDCYNNIVKEAICMYSDRLIIFKKKPLHELKLISRNIHAKAYIFRPDMADDVTVLF